MFLDEMLTRELIKLDDIETEGKENVRQARKQAIKSIQESINLLESKVPLPGQEQKQQTEIPETTENPTTLTETEQPEETVDNKPIPLPPGPNSSPIPPKEEASENEIKEEEVPIAITETETKPDENKPEDQISEAPTTNIEQLELLPTVQDSTTEEAQETLKAAKSPKKVKKTKKQPTPVSIEPIPLPAPIASDNETK